jgi:hypothetical protein
MTEVPAADALASLLPVSVLHRIALAWTLTLAFCDEKPPIICVQLPAVATSPLEAVCACGNVCICELASWMDSVFWWLL